MSLARWSNAYCHSQSTTCTICWSLASYWRVALPLSTRLLGIPLPRQDLEALRVGVGHDIRARGEVDFRRVDVEIPQADLGRQPLGEQLEVQQLVRRQQRLPFLVGDHRERVMIGARHAPGGYELVRLGAS